MISPNADAGASLVLSRSMTMADEYLALLFQFAASLTTMIRYDDGSTEIRVAVDLVAQSTIQWWSPTTQT